MFRKLLIALVAVTCLLLGVVRSDETSDNDGLPLVSERVDAVIVCRTQGNSFARIIFIKNDTILATRLLLDDMLWTCEGEDFVLMWEDYSMAHRIVTFKTYIHIVGASDPLQDANMGPWWAMNRNMRDLKQPD